MTAKVNFLLGKGERLTESVIVPRGFGIKEPPYTFSEAKMRVRPMLESIDSTLASLPDDACPNDQAVVKITLNPEYLSKSAYPSNLLMRAGLEAVGSKPAEIVPEKKSRNREPELTQTTELFVSGTRSAFRTWKEELPTWSSEDFGADQLASIEQIRVPSSDEKIKSLNNETQNMLFELVLHAGSNQSKEAIVRPLEKYLASLGVQANFNHVFLAGGLCFLEVEAEKKLAPHIAKYSFIRALRQMPKLRMLRPTIRSSGLPSENVILPQQGAMDQSLSAVVFDGGLPANHVTAPWANAYDAPGVGGVEPDLLEHGQAVTSALLFGNINPGKELPRPYGNVDHYRVLDTEPGQDPYELFEVLSRVHSVLKSKSYDFINLSIGPELPIEDDEVHAWTAVLDEYLSDGETLATIAVGNGGERASDLGFNRIQVPADCVNALAVGACNSPDGEWARAVYSSVGPGRSPGVTKPDLVDFGGSFERPFIVLGPSEDPMIQTTGGTSFASPSVLRLGMGVKAHFGQSLSPLAIRALLVHSVEQSEEHSRSEIGWGRAARSLDDIVTCSDDTVRIVYQGQIQASKYIRMPIPLPAEDLTGMVTVKATLCFATSVDPNHPSNYTKSGLEVFFRPHSEKRKNDEQEHADTKPFFGKNIVGKSEQELRHDAHKWENCLHHSSRHQGRSLKNPVFDIHYNARSEGKNDTSLQYVSYAMIISVKAPKVADLYDSVVRRYQTQLEQLRPVIDIPIQVKE